MTPAENGLRGYRQTLRTHGVRQMNRWRRLGGRMAEPTLTEIERAEQAIRSRLGKRHTPTRDEVRAEIRSMRETGSDPGLTRGKEVLSRAR